MNKKMISLAMALTIGAVPAAAFAQEETVGADQLFADALDYAAAAQQVTAEGSMDFSGSLKLASEDAPETSLGFSLKGQGALEKTAEPLKLHMAADMSVGLMGIGQDMAVEFYGIQTEDGKNMDLYVKADNGYGETVWQRDSAPFGDMEESMKLPTGKELLEAVQELADEGMTLDWTVEKTADQYQISTTVNLEEFLAPVMEQEELDEEELLMAEMITDFLSADITAAFDLETHALEALHIDLGNSDTRRLAEIVSELMGMQGEEALEDFQFDLILDSAYVDLNCDYDHAAEISLPAEAENAEDFAGADLDAQQEIIQEVETISESDLIEVESVEEQ